MTRPMNRSNARLLLVLDRRPDRQVLGGAVDLVDDPEQVFEPDLGRPRIGLDVEEQVPWRRFRQGAEASARVGSDPG